MPEKILIIDDEEFVRSLVHRALGKEGEFSVLEAIDGPKGLEIARAQKPPVIVCDIMMPRMDGFQVVREIREDPRIAGSHLILLTAKETVEDKVRGFELGADDYLVKPFHPLELRSRVRAGVRLQSMKKGLELRNALIERAYQDKSAFLSTMSHELRTPLNAIIGFSDLLLERSHGEINEKQAKYLGNIRKSGGHLLALVNDILDLSKIESGRLDLTIAPFWPAQAIADLLALMKGQADQKGVALDDTVSSELPLLSGDEQKFKQVVLNLLSNAVKFTPAGGRAGVRCRKLDDRHELEFCVWDTGPGIPAEEQQAIFEPFKQGNLGVRKMEGTGLGLSISRSLVELHGGRMWVESEVGQGSRFYFMMPIDHA